jgi:hypothetical protein
MKLLIIGLLAILGSALFCKGVFLLIFHGGNWLATQPPGTGIMLVGGSLGFYVYTLCLCAILMSVNNS